MTEFNISLAGINIAVSALHDSTKEFCRDYITDAVPDFCIFIDQADIDKERMRSAAQDERDGIPVRKFSDRYLETLALCRKAAAKLIDYDTVLFHGSAVARDGKVYLFTAPSGTGKTTHTRLWLHEFSDAFVLNGDKPLLHAEDGRIMACGTPWQGKENLGCNRILPLEAICLIERSEENRIERVAQSEALTFLLKQTHMPEDPASVLKTLRITGKLCSPENNVRLYRLGCNMDPEAAHFSFGGMQE